MFDARYWMLGAGALGGPRGMVWGGRREEGSGWGTHVYLWLIHFDIWQNQYNIVKFKNKIKFKKIIMIFSEKKLIINVNLPIIKKKKSINSSALSFLYSLTLTSIHDHRKIHSLD